MDGLPETWAAFHLQKTEACRRSSTPRALLPGTRKHSWRARRANTKRQPDQKLSLSLTLRIQKFKKDILLSWGPLALPVYSNVCHHTRAPGLAS